MIYSLNDINKIPCNSYGVIGYPIEHSLSPIIHKGLSLSDNYYRILLSPEELEKAIPLLKERLLGFNITIPHKLAIMKYIDVLDETAIAYGAVNTVKISNGKLYGYNTDGIGFLSAIKRAGMSINNREVLLIGSGGVARVLAYEVVKAGSKLTIFCRNTISGRALADNILKSYPKALIKITDKLSNIRYDILLNATPQGMYPNIDGIPVPVEIISNIDEIFDTIYNPSKTRLLIEAEKAGKKTMNGLYMLVAQAAGSREIWTNTSYRENAFDDIMKVLENKLNNDRREK